MCSAFESLQHNLETPILFSWINLRPRSPARPLVRYRTEKKKLNRYPSLFYKLIPANGEILSIVGDAMNTGGCKGLDAQTWKDLYQVAIHESDLNKLPERITDAETALVMRARELFYTCGDRIGEQESLDYAMCILQALRSSLRASAIQKTTDFDYLRSA